MKSFIRELLITAVLALALTIGIRATVQSFVVVGISMETSFQEGQRVMVARTSYFFGEPERGDVIVFQPLTNQNEDYIKRIIGLPGDTVEIRRGRVYINNILITEPYINQSPAYTMSSETVPQNSYFVLGDNRNNSNDSHNGWFVPRPNIVGKVWLRYWPPGSVGMAPHYNLQPQLVTP